MKNVKRFTYGALLTPWMVCHAQTSAVHSLVNILLLDILPFSSSCRDKRDSDSDRLLNCFETNTGVFVDSSDTGTDPFDDDTDNDGIKDGDEVLGTLAELDLPALGTNPLRKNILLEFDWYDDATECAFHSHRPNAEVITRITNAYAEAPVNNPDGSTGIDLILDYGQSALFSGGNEIFDANGLIKGGINGREFKNRKNANFAFNRHGYFHYVLLPHRYNIFSASSGQAELPGDDLIVSLYCSHSDRNVANTILHELGHNLNLRHGGNENCNYKPNYNSIMNYRFQFRGVDDDSSCDAHGDNMLSYSQGQRISLDEANLDEFSGVCGTHVIDWNQDQHFSDSIVHNINGDDNFENSNCGGLLTILNDFDDWANIVYSGLNDADGNLPSAKEIITETLVPPFP